MRNWENSFHSSSGRYLSWSIGGKSHYFCSLQGILRILELVLVLIVLILARVGDEGNILHFGGADADFIGIGASVGLTFILLAFIVCHLVGHLPPTLLVSTWYVMTILIIIVNRRS